MRARLRRQRAPDGRRFTAIDWHRRSRAALVSRTMHLVMHGNSLAAVARHEHMPRHATLQRWLARDADLRARYEIARRTHRDVLADELVALADRAAARAHGRRRAMVERFAIEVRKWRAALAAPQKGTHGNDGRAAAHRGISEKAVAMLEQAADRVLPQLDTGDVPGGASVEAPAAPESNGAPRDETSPDSASFPRKRESSPQRNNLDPRSYGRVAPRPFEKEGRGDDDKQETPPHASPESPPSDPPSTWRIRFDVDAPRPEPPWDPLKW